MSASMQQTRLGAGMTFQHVLSMHGGRLETCTDGKCSSAETAKIQMYELDGYRENICSVWKEDSKLETTHNDAAKLVHNATYWQLAGCNTEHLEGVKDSKHRGETQQREAKPSYWSQKAKVISSQLALT